MTTPGPGGGSLGSATGSIVINFNDRGTRAAQGALRDVGNSADSAAVQAGKAGKKIAAAGAIIATGFLFAVKAAADFEAGLSAVAAVSGATAAEMDQVREKALQLGKDTKFSAAEGAQAIEELVKAGISISDVMAGAADATVALAAAGEIDLPRAATIASNAMNQFQLAAKDMPRIADLLAGAANASAISVDDLGESLNYAGPVAHALGVSIDDLSTATAILGNSGIRASSAGTALRAILSKLVPTTKKAADVFDEMGLLTDEGTSAFEDATGAIRPLNEVVQILNDKTKNLSKTERNTFAKKAFGLESLAAASVLMDQTAESVDAMAASIDKTTAADVAAKRMDNLKGAVEQLKGSFETFMIVIGTPLLGAVGKVVDVANKLITVFLELPEPLQDFLSLLGASAGVFLLAVGGILIVTAQFTKLKVALQGLAATALWQTIATNVRGLIFMMGAAGPWVAAFAAAALVVGALFLMNKKGKASIEGLTEAFKNNADALAKENRELIANSYEKDGNLVLAEKLGVKTEDLVKATAGSVDAQKNLNDALARGRAPLQGQIEDLNRRIDASGGLDLALIDERDALFQQEAAFNQLEEAYKRNVGAVGRSAEEAKRFKEATADTAAESQSAATTIADRLNRAMGENKTKAQDAAGANTKLAGGVKETGDAAADTEKEISNLNNAIQKLFDEAYGSDEALDAFQTKLNSIKGLAKENGTALQGTSNKAIANRDAFREAARGIGEWAQKLNEEGAPPEEVLAGIENMRRKLMNEGAAAGYSRGEVGKLVGVLDDLAGSYEAQINLDAGPATAEARGFLRYYDSIKSKTVTLTFDQQGNQTFKGSVGGKSTKFATGGLVRKATYALVGEAGPEVVAPVPDMAEWFLRIHEAGRISAVNPSSTVTGGRATSGSDRPSGTRVLRGELDISSRGKAYIRGLAEDLYDDNEAFAVTHRRMG